MKPFPEFKDMDPSFWAFIRFISEMLGYTDRRYGIVKTYTKEEIKTLCTKQDINISPDVLDKSIAYIQMRANLLNEFVRSMLMDVESASKEYKIWEHIYRIGNYHCKIPLNKQKGDKKQVAFFTAIINIITEQTIQKFTNQTDRPGFDDDPRGLVYIWDHERHLIGSSSRRFDGAYPSIENPKIVWEIKEYYYATTFGSRVADGVYETQLDGFEFQEIFNRTGHKIYHVLFIDAYKTWWQQGKSYLCRLIDSMNSGSVDEVIVGKEVLTRWPELLKTIILK